MKCMKKLVAVLLTAVMAMTLLTACGGGGGGASNGYKDVSEELTKAINAKLETNGAITRNLTYDVELSKKLKKAYDVYTDELKKAADPSNPTDEEIDAAEDVGFAAAGLYDGKHYVMMDDRSNTIDVWSTHFAKMIQNREQKKIDTGVGIAKKIGYLTLVDAQKKPIAMWATVEYAN